MTSALEDFLFDLRGYLVVEGAVEADHVRDLNAAFDAFPDLEGAIEVHLRAGDALLFTDGLMHGAASNVNGRERRVVIYRYGPSWGASRFGYECSPELLAQLTKPRRRILQPIRPSRPQEAP